MTPLKGWFRRCSLIQRAATGYMRPPEDINQRHEHDSAPLHRVHGTVHAPRPQNENSGKNGNAACLLTLAYSANTTTASPEKIGADGHPAHDGATSGNDSGKKRQTVCVAPTALEPRHVPKPHHKPTQLTRNTFAGSSAAMIPATPAMIPATPAMRFAGQPLGSHGKAECLVDIGTPIAI